MKAYEQHLAKSLEKNKEKYFKKMEELTKHPLPYKEITCYLTTLPRCPYKWEYDLYGCIIKLKILFESCFTKLYIFNFIGDIEIIQK